METLIAKKAACSENDALASYLLQKRNEIAETPKGISEKTDKTLSRAYVQICSSKVPITSLKDLALIKGVGKWILKLMQGYFRDTSEPEETTQKDETIKTSKRYLPQRNSVAYALLITLYKAASNGDGYMGKQQLIDYAEASGLSRAPIAPGKSNGFGNPCSSWYSGWSCMKNLITKGLVLKSNCPAKYMLSDEGIKTARECVMRSGLPDPSVSTNIVEQCDTSPEYEINLEASDEETKEIESDHCFPVLKTCGLRNPNGVSVTMSACSSERIGKQELCCDLLSRPPLCSGEEFADVYEIVLILDDREHLNGKRGRNAKLIESICKEYSIKIEFRLLPVGDGTWIARNRHTDAEYVLDFIVERKSIEDFRSSIKDNRYKNQKVKLLRCGLRKLIYLVEGDPNTSEAAASIKTACFTTEILEGFDVQRTANVSDTLRKYVSLTLSIARYYVERVAESTRVCPEYGEFVKRCKDIEKMTVSDVFAIQLMQVPQVTEEVALAVIDLYPTVASLARAYSILDGDARAQEEMLRKQSNNRVNACASKNIFHLVWGNA